MTYVYWTKTDPNIYSNAKNPITRVYVCETEEERDFAMYSLIMTTNEKFDFYWETTNKAKIPKKYKNVYHKLIKTDKNKFYSRVIK